MRFGPVRVIIPLKGWSSADEPGNSTFDPEEDMVFVEELRGLLKPQIELSLLDGNMEDPNFQEHLQGRPSSFSTPTTRERPNRHGLPEQVKEKKREERPPELFIESGVN